MICDYKNPVSDKKYYDMLKDLSLLPIRFSYDGEKYVGLGGLEEKNREFFRGDGVETAIVIFSLDLLEITLKLTHYFNYGVNEWTVWFANNTNKNSKVLCDVKTQIEFEGERPVLKGILGDHENYYQPYEKDLTTQKTCFVSDTGRATHI